MRVSEDAVERFYRKFAKVYDLIFDKVMHPGRVAAVRSMSLSSGDRVLEVGVGTGLNLPLYPLDVQVVGVDVSGPMLAKAHHRMRAMGMSNVELCEMDVGKLTFPDESFDHVYAPYVVSVVPDLAAAMAEMKRVCRPGGSIVIVNHFHSRNPLGAWFEKTFTPLTRHVGFRMDLPLGAVLQADDLLLQQNRRVNLFGIWRLLVLRKPVATEERAALAPTAESPDLSSPGPSPAT
jgi:phosphatidylethanolamine/phosphatidyl-N-methylethanolamine N-methyltransferase